MSGTKEEYRDYVSRRANDKPVATDRQGLAEIVVFGTVIGHDLGLLAPRAAVVIEDVGRSRGKARIIVVGGSGDDVTAVDRHRCTKKILDFGVRSRQLGLLGPGPAAALEHVDRSGIDGAFVLVRGPDSDEIPADPDRPAYRR